MNDELTSSFSPSHANSSWR